VLIHFKGSAWRQTKAHEYLTRFVLGGLVCLAAGWIAHRYGPVIGGLFLGFPAIFPASATLVEQHERAKKARAGIAVTLRGRLSAALDARGAAMGALALLAFAGVVWKGVSTFPPVAVLGAALLAWGLVSGTLWRLRRLHTRCHRE
jgi:hypothetical protein